jgi:hypothetical protein
MTEMPDLDGTDRKTKTTDPSAHNAKNHGEVAEDPEKDKVGPESFVKIVHILPIRVVWGLKASQSSFDGRLKEGVNIDLGPIQFFNEF